jgi:N-acylglucosamine 2-epimerase
MNLMDDAAVLGSFYERTLLEDVVPFWLKYGLDEEHGGMITALDRYGSVLDTDKSVWFQGRAGWMFGALHQQLGGRQEWLAAAESCVRFSQAHCHSPSGKMYFTVTRTGEPLRMRRYVYSESFAAISYGLHAVNTGLQVHAEAALQAWETYLRYSFTPGVMLPKMEATRPMRGIGPLMIAMVTAQELRATLGEMVAGGRSCSQWIDFCVAEILDYFFKPELEVLMETVGLKGEVLDHMDGRTLNPGHAIECAWFILREGQLREDAELIRMGCRILDWMWQRGWDSEHGGLLYFTDLYGRPVQEYWAEMKFWWPHCEAILACILAWQLTGEPRYALMHERVHEWSFRHFPDAEHGEWYGYLRRDGTVAQSAKGNHFKGPFHLPRMLLLASQWLK